MHDWILWSAVIFSTIVLAEIIRLDSKLYMVLKTGPKLPLDDGSVPLPFLSIIIPAKDEQDTIADTIRSILASEGVDFELFVVNDRSSDETGRIIDDFAAQDPGIKPVAIQNLPEGWTGKTHAMYEAALQTRGDMLLFTDADSVLNPQTLRSALRFMISEDLDVLSLLPGFRNPGFAENVVHIHLALGFSSFNPLTEVNDSTRPAAIASGCFIMITRKAYEKIGTWRTFRREITEDVAMSRAVKQAGLKLRVIRGYEWVKTRPFSGISGLIKFWRRTFYGGLRKSIPKIIKLNLNYFLLTLCYLIFAASLVGVLSGNVGAANTVLLITTGAVTTLTIIPTCILVGQENGSRLHGLLTPIGLLISGYVAFSTLTTIVLDKGIRWRGSHYK